MRNTGQVVRRRPGRGRPGCRGHLLIDLNEWSAEGTTALAAVEVIEDKRIVYATSDAGSTGGRGVRDVASGEDLQDRIDYRSSFPRHDR